MNACRSATTALVALACLGAPANATERTGAFAIRGGTALSGALGDASAAMLDRPDVMLWNPASLLRLRTPAIELAYQDVYGLGLARHGHAAIAWRTSREALVDEGTPRLESHPLSGPAIGFALDVTTVDVGADGGESYTEAAPSAALAVQLSPRLALGGLVRFLGVTSSLDDVGGGGYAVDFGLAFDAETVRATAAVRNFLGSISWTDGGPEALRHEVSLAVDARIAPWARLGAGITDELGDAVDAVTIAALVTPHDHVTIAAGWQSRVSGPDRWNRFTPGLSLSAEPVTVDYAFVTSGSGTGDGLDDGPGDTHRVSISVDL